MSATIKAELGENFVTPAAISPCRWSMWVGSSVLVAAPPAYVVLIVKKNVKMAIAARITHVRLAVKVTGPILDRAFFAVGLLPGSRRISIGGVGEIVLSFWAIHAVPTGLDRLIPLGP
jgi:hypothetical protein